jgi:broad specificity phosphatase PhoE
MTQHIYVDVMMLPTALRFKLLQGNTDESELTDMGRAQAVLAREALQHVEFVR